MHALRHLLVALDFDPVSEHALDYAVDLAERLGAKLTVIHVYSLPVLNALDAEYILTADEAARKADGAQKLLDAAVAPFIGRNVSLTPLLLVGSAPQEIIDQAKHLGADMIVVGSHGRGLLGRAILGSVAQSILRGAHVPVLTVKAAPHA